MTTTQFIETIREHIGRDELETALGQLQALLKNSPRLDEVILQSARFQDIRKQIRSGTTSNSEANLTQNQIRAGLLDLLREIETQGSIPTLQEELERTISIVNSENVVEPQNFPWHKQLWVKALAMIAITGAVLIVLDTGASLYEKLYLYNPKEISFTDLPIKIKYDKKSSLLVSAKVPHKLIAQTYLVDYIDPDSIKISDIKISNKRVINTDSITSRSIQLYPGVGYGMGGGEIQNFHELEYNLNVYFALLPSIRNAKPGKIYNLGYVVFSVPYFVNGDRKIKEQRVCVELEVE